MSIKDVLLPFTAWKNVIKEPVTVRDPFNERPGAPRYRGFHKNDPKKCIGCGTCETICQNAAIDLVPAGGIEPKQGDSGLRPRIDYGRCCWCGLCVDICATGSLSMSNEYVWTSTDPDDFRFTPGVDKKPWDNSELGYTKAEGFELNELNRLPMDELHAEERADSFIEIVRGYSKEKALAEADRCVSCGICIATCPAHMNIPGYIEAIRKNDFQKGLRILYETNPLPEVCGRVCTHKCETVCAMGHRGEAISIRWLKRYVADQIPLADYKKILGFDQPEKSGRRIAIIGSGPAGLSAAYYLALLGHTPVIFESQPKAGGMMRYGIPEYRLPYDQLDKDIALIESLGTEIKANTRVGKDIIMEELKKQFDAVYIATGLHQGRSTRIPGSDHKNVYQAIDLLRDFTKGIDIPAAGKIAVIGGGNVAMDIARTLARLQRQKYSRVNLTLTCLETEDIMPADREEIVESREEGITILPGRGPRSIELIDGNIKGLHTVRCVSVFDENRRFAPRFDEADTSFIEAEMIVESIGQGMDLSYLEGEFKKDIVFDQRGRIKVSNTYQTSLPWLFAGGDIIEGPDVIHAIANGHAAAKGIDTFLRGVK